MMPGLTLNEAPLLRKVEEEEIVGLEGWKTI